MAEGSYDENCIFCKILKGEIDSKKVYEDDVCLAILDINPVVPGHCLIIPKTHVFVLPQLPADIVGRLGVASQKVSRKLLGALDFKGTSVFVANGGSAGQRSPHAIIHVIPRKKDDGINLNPEVLEKHIDTQKELLVRLKKSIFPQGGG